MGKTFKSWQNIYFQFQQSDPGIFISISQEGSTFYSLPFYFMLFGLFTLFMLLGLRGLLGLLGGELNCDYNEFLLFGVANSFIFYYGIPNYVLNNFNLLFFMSSICISA